MSEHVSLDELADADAGLLDPVRAGAVRAHLVDCAECRRRSAALETVSARLGAEPAPSMPPEIAARLSATLARESADRTGGVTALADVRRRSSRTSLGPFAAGLPRRSRLGRATPWLAAAAAAVLVGFGGYVLSASAGLNEPPMVASAINVGELGADAQALEQTRDLDPHRFSRAWQCGRAVTRGRITGIAATTVSGAPALLVYTRADDQTQVTVVTGCSSADPSAGPSAVIDR